MRGIGDILSDPIDLPRLAAVLVNPAVAVPTREVFAKLRLGPGRPAAPCLASKDAALDAIARGGNDLEPAAIEVAPVIADVIAAIRDLPGCRLARMSGSGATCFGLFDSTAAASAAARRLRAGRPAWWVRATALADRMRRS